MGADSEKIRLESVDPATARLDLAGTWRGPAAAGEILDRIGKQAGLKRLVLHDAGIAEWDSGLLTFIRALGAIARSRAAELDVSGMPEGVRRLLRLAEAVPERKDAERGPESVSLLARVGGHAINAHAEFKASVSFLGELAQAFYALARGRAVFRRVDFARVLEECGPAALPIISMISVLVGMILAFLGSVQLRMFGAEIYIANAVGVGMVREMGALMTGIIMAGRTGASFAARLGTMQVNEEIDALRTMGFSPVEFLVLPRAAALMIMMPLLAIYANFFGMLGGGLVGVLMLDLTATQYFRQTVNSITINGVLAGLIKSSVFGALVAYSGCMRGMRCGRSAAAVGEATTAAVVSAIVYIVVADAILSVIYTIIKF